MLNDLISFSVYCRSIQGPTINNHSVLQCSCSGCQGDVKFKNCSYLSSTWWLALDRRQTGSRWWRCD